MLSCFSVVATLGVRKKCNSDKLTEETFLERVGTSHLLFLTLFYTVYRGRDRSLLDGTLPFDFTLFKESQV